MKKLVALVSGVAALNVSGCEDLCAGCEYIDILCGYVPAEVCDALNQVCAYFC